MTFAVGDMVRIKIADSNVALRYYTNMVGCVTKTDVGETFPYLVFFSEQVGTEIFAEDELEKVDG